MSREQEQGGLNYDSDPFRGPHAGTLREFNSGYIDLIKTLLYFHNVQF